METVTFKAEPGTVIHNGGMNPIKFDSRGLFTASKPKDIEILRSRKYVEELEAGAGEPAPKETPKEKKARAGEPAPKETPKEKKAREAAEKAAKEAADAAKLAQGGTDDKGPDAGNFHIITKEDIENNPALAEKYKVGDSVDPAALQ